MAKSIDIVNIKGIRHMGFCFPEKNDVYLLVGPNGAGKTTLLVCIDRICNPYAFARGFSHPKNIAGYDEYIDSEIQYNNDVVCVKYRKKKWKWSASPRKGSAELLRSFGFSDSVFIKADSKRIDATQEEIEKGTVSKAEPNVIQVMNQIFETERFNQLKQLKVPQGRGKAPIYFNIIKEGSVYYTEKRFSTGELAILHLIQSLKNANKGSIVLLDEAEIALHPRVQINLLDYLKTVSIEKDLMVLISTHSPTMIKSTRPDKIIMLDSDQSGNISVVTPCYPARALGRVDYEEASGFDFIFFVEDEMARSFLKKITDKYITLIPKHATSSTSIIPVGGYRETAALAINTSKQLFDKTNVCAFVDTDAFFDLDTNPSFKELYESNKDLIHDLTITPELKFVEVLTCNQDTINRQIKEKFHCDIKTIVKSKEYCDCKGENERRVAKDKFDIIVKQCCKSSGNCESLVVDALISIVVGNYSDCEIKRILGPVFNRTKG